MHVLWMEETLRYDGTQLRAHWIRRRTGLVGDAMVAFRGPCNIARAEIADLMDVDGPGIAGDDMVHFLWECFDQRDLNLAVHRQRLLSAQAAECLRSLAPQECDPLVRDGDDLYVGEGKLSISIATVSPVSTLTHFAVNASQGGAPVRTAALSDLGIEPRVFGEALLAAVEKEQDSIATARASVRAKGGI